MTLPPLPLIDGCLFIDNSSWVEAMSTCHRYLQYKSLNLRIPTAEKPSLNFGSAIHNALEYRYRTYRNTSVDLAFYEHIAAMLTDFFAAHPPPADDWRTLNWAMEVIKRYNARYDIEDFNLLVNEKNEAMVELPFALPLYTHGTARNELVPVIYSGKIDLPISIDGQVFVCDHKTTSMLGDMFWNKMRMTSQQKGYCWAFEQISGRKVAGYMINAIRTKQPPLYVTNGTTSTRGKSQTPESWWNESLARERFLLVPSALDEWKNNTIDLVEEFFWHYARGYLPMKTEWCSSYGKCPYYDVCRVQSSDRDFLLQSGEFTANEWTPLKQPTESKQ